MYSTRTRVHARIPNGHPREEKRASDKSSRTSRRAERVARAPTAAARRAPTSPRAEHVDFRARIIPRKSARKSVSVSVLLSVSVPWNLSYNALSIVAGGKNRPYILYGPQSIIARQRASVYSKLLCRPRNFGYYHIFER